MKLTIILYYCLLGTFLFAQTNSVNIWLEKGKNALEQRNYSEAIRHYAQAAQLQPKQAFVYTQMMKAAIFKRDLSVFKRCITQLENLKYPLSVNIYLTYAQLATKQRLYEEALDMLNRAEQFHNNHQSIFLHRATVYEKLTDYLAAQEVLNRAYVQYPSSKELIHRLAKVYMAAGDDSKSIQFFKMLLQDELYKDAAFTSLALLYTRQYESAPQKNSASLDEALKFYNLYLERHPKDQNTRQIIQSIYAMQDQ